MVEDPNIIAAVCRMNAAPYRSVLRIGLDLIFWGAAVWIALAVGKWWAVLPAIFFIGAVPLHDLLVQGHEGTHDLISRNRYLNEILGWFTLAFVGMSITAHKAFHLDHHRLAHTSEDPEYRLFNGVVRGVPGWAYLFIPSAAQIGVNIYPFRRRLPIRDRLRIVADLAGALM